MSSDPDFVRKMSARDSLGLAAPLIFVRCPLAIAIFNMAACSVSGDGMSTQIVVNGVTAAKDVQKIM